MFGQLLPECINIIRREGFDTYDQLGLILIRPLV